ncbi:MAG: hypothetical protein ACTSYZ_06705 [Candidatus Helarchaeota archaeon]
MAFNIELLMDIVSLGIILVAIIINLVISVKSYRSYKKNKVINTLIFTLTAIFIAFAMIFLVAEKLFLSDLLCNEFLGMQIFGSIAVVISGGAIVSIDAFAFNMVFTKKYKILTIFSALFVSVYLGFFLFDPTKHVSEGEISFSWDPLAIGFPITRLMVLIISFVLLTIPTLVFFYYSIKIRRKSTTRSTRSLTLGLGVMAFASAYIIELFGLDPLTTTIMRIFYIVGSILLYYGLFGIKEKST